MLERVDASALFDQPQVPSRLGTLGEVIEVVTICAKTLPLQSHRSRHHPSGVSTASELRVVQNAHQLSWVLAQASKKSRWSV
jgi:hypothetical protein